MQRTPRGFSMAEFRFELDFEHPNVPDGSPLKQHITYSIVRPGSC